MGENTSQARAITFPYVGEIKGSKVWRNTETGVEIIKGANFAEVGLYYVAVPALSSDARTVVTTADALAKAREYAARAAGTMREEIAAAYGEALVENGSRDDAAVAERASFDQLYRWSQRHDLPSGRREHIGAAIAADHADALDEAARRAANDPDSLIGKRVRVSDRSGGHTGEVIDDFGPSVSVRIGEGGVITTNKLNVSLIEDDVERPTVHYMADDLLDACRSADRDERLIVTPVIEDVTCTPCGRIARRAVIDKAHAEALWENWARRPEVDRRNARIMVDFVKVACDAPEQLTAWRKVHGIALGVDTTVEDYIGAFEADHAEALAWDEHVASEGLTVRIVRRAQYDALRAVLSALDGWERGTLQNHEAMSHRDDDCCRAFAPDDIRRMVNDAARELDVRRPWNGDAR